MPDKRYTELLDELRASTDQLLGGKGIVLLFGSCARGDYREGSDWDLLVLLDRDGDSSWQDYNEIGYPLNELFWRNNQDVNTIIQTRSEWQRKSFTPFYKNVMRDAIAL